MKCFICNNECESSQTINVVTCKCQKCGTYKYEKNFLTTYNYYLSFNESKKEQLSIFLSNYVKKHNVCFVDDFETSLVEGCELKELRDILNLAGLEVTHNNTIDSNYKD